jgi:L-cysteine:1D-myo-inositol 2-amino-2-deoxy-alpha-D-glucopyranoside ligase
VYSGVVEVIPAVVEAVEVLLAAGAAYRVPTPDALVDDGLGDVYADLTADIDFGAVAGLDDDTMRALSHERGGDPDRPGKRAPLDPLLWRRERAGEPAWDGGTLGRGRPGWHIECAVIARDALGLPFDVEGGGSDLQFPHHEMSTSHARLLDAGRGARIHLHTGMVGLDGHKMSKSRGNLVLVSRLREQGVDPMAVRLAILAHRYRDDWDWTDESLSSAQARLEHWRRAVSGNGGPDADSTLAGVRAALADDLDTPAALALIDAWSDLAIAGTAVPVEGAPGVIGRTLDALLGIRL